MVSVERGNVTRYCHSHKGNRSACCTDAVTEAEEVQNGRLTDLNLHEAHR